MIVELGHFALILAFVVACLQAVLPLIGAQRNDPVLMAVAGPAATVQFLLVAVSFAALTYAFVTDDFSLVLVVNNSHTLKPMLYKVAGVWGNHEGSLLLWVLALSLYGSLIQPGLMSNRDWICIPESRQTWSIISQKVALRNS